MATWVMGKRFSYTDSEFQDMLKRHTDLTKNGPVGIGLIVAYPFLKYLIPDLLGYNAQTEI